MDDVEHEFYEADEPVENIRAAFDRGDKQVTQEPIEAVLDAIKLPLGATAAGGTLTIGSSRHGLVLPNTLPVLIVNATLLIARLFSGVH